MGKIGSINDRIFNSVTFIVTGREFLYTPKKEAKGLVIFNNGKTKALNAFKDAKASKDIKTIIQAELTFLKQDLALTKDKLVLTSLNRAIISFDDAMLAYNVLITKGEYEAANKTYASVEGKSRIKGVPVDAFHNACNSHRARLSNSLRSTSVSIQEKELIQERAKVVDFALKLYIEKQREVLGLPKDAKVKSNDREI
jgi:hypothetical protein